MEAYPDILVFGPCCRYGVLVCDSLLVLRVSTDFLPKFSGTASSSFRIIWEEQAYISFDVCDILDLYHRRSAIERERSNLLCWYVPLGLCIYAIVSHACSELEVRLPIGSTCFVTRWSPYCIYLAAMLVDEAVLCCLVLKKYLEFSASHGPFLRRTIGRSGMTSLVLDSLWYSSV